MKKEVIIGLTTILLVATPAFAAPGGNSSQAKNNNGQTVAGQKTAEVPPVTLPTNVPVTVPPVGNVETESLAIEADDVLITVTPTPTKKVNKGQLKKVEGVSTQAEECDPNAEWKNHGAYVSCVAKTHPGGDAVSAAARSDVGKKHLDETPTGSPSATPSVSPTPITSAEEEVELTSNPLETFVHAIGRFLHSLPFFNKHS
jgi:hypothetical protein